jgi:ribosomal protein S27AE
MRNTIPEKYNTSITFVPSLIAPCGMNCGSCIGFMRPKNKCPGCWFVDQGKARVRCVIRNCDLLKENDAKFCFDCQKYPCPRLKQLDKRYRTKYNTSFIENLMIIKQNGIDFFLDFETKRRKCPNCGATLSVHRDQCLACMSNTV